MTCWCDESEGEAESEAAVGEASILVGAVGVWVEVERLISSVLPGRLHVTQYDTVVGPAVKVGVPEDADVAGVAVAVEVPLERVKALVFFWQQVPVPSVSQQ